MNELEKEHRKIVANNIKKLVQEKGITQKELAKAIGMSQNIITEYVKLRSFPPAGVIQKMADYFGVNKSDIDTTWKPSHSDIINEIVATSAKLTRPRQEIVLDTAETQFDKQKAEEYFEKNAIDMFTLDDYKNKVKTVTLDFYDDPASAGTGYYLENDNKSTVTLPLFAVPDSSDFVITIAGNSMEPEYHDKDYVFVQQTFDVFEGDIGIFVVDGESYIKELRDEGGKICLHSLNEEYEDRIIEESQYFRVVGKVIGRYAD